MFFKTFKPILMVYERLEAEREEYVEIVSRVDGSVLHTVTSDYRSNNFNGGWEKLLDRYAKEEAEHRYLVYLSSCEEEERSKLEALQTYDITLFVEVMEGLLAPSEEEKEEERQLLAGMACRHHNRRL